MIIALAALVSLCHVQGRSPLDAYPQLSAKLTVECPAETVDQLLKELSEKTGVHLLAANPVKEDIVVMYADDLPGKEILAEIAHHFSWSWESNHDALVLKQTSKQENDEARAVTDELAKSYAAWQKNAIEASKAPPATGADISAYRDLQDARRKYFETPHNYDQATDEDRVRWGAELRALMTKGKELGRRISPAWRLADEVVANLGPADYRQLDRTGRLVFSYNPTLWQRPLSGRAKGYAEDLVKLAAKDSAIDSDKESERIQQAQDFGYGARRRFTPDEVATVRVTISRNRIVDPLFPNAGWVQVAIIAKSGEKLSDKSLTMSQFGQADKNVSPLRPKDEFDEPLTQTEELKTLTTVKGGFRALPPESESLAAFGKAGTKVLPVAGAARVLVAVAKAGNVSVISDLYDPRGYRLPIWRFETMREALDGFSGRFGQVWSKNGSWIEMRTQNWQFLRSMTVPPSKLFAFRDMIVKKERSPLAIAMSIATAITDHQAASWYLSWLFMHDPKAGELIADEKRLYALRFLATLPAQDLDKMSNSVSYRYGSLTGAQRELIDAWVYRMVDRDFDQNIEFRAGGPEGLEARDVNWIRTNWPKFGQSGSDNDFEPSQQYPNGIPSDAAISLHSSIGNAMMLGTERGMSQAMSEAQFAQSGYFDPASKEIYVQMAREDRIFLSVDPSPLAMKAVEFGAISPLPDSRPTTIGLLPDDVLSRIRKAYDIWRKGG
ncbi:MAG TPA: hypothetical protein VHE55_10520 [Fimbriimonadaceae bacterium]|nr:hypothetical protein [Fimbriimonadaceae bacterium]